MEKDKKYRIYKTIMMLAIVIFITFMVTSISLYTYFTKNPIILVSNTKSTQNDIANKLENYRQIIEKYYLGEIDDTKLEEGAIKGYIEGLKYGMAWIILFLIINLISKNFTYLSLIYYLILIIIAIVSSIIGINRRKN